MPPKKGNAPSAKTEKKKMEKVIEDKTFGLKNKNKGKSVQKYIKGVATQVSGGKVSLANISHCLPLSLLLPTMNAVRCMLLCPLIHSYTLMSIIPLLCYVDMTDADCRKAGF